MIKHTAIFHYRPNSSNEFTRNKNEWVARGGYTIAFVTSEDGLLRIGVSRCNKLDAFVRKVAVKRATGRASSSAFSLSLPNKFSMTELGDLGLVLAKRGAVTFEQIGNAIAHDPDAIAILTDTSYRACQTDE